VSYADFITLLFAFFVVLYASSQVDKHRVGQLATAIQVAFQELGAFPSSGKVSPGSSVQEIEAKVTKLQTASVVVPARTAVTTVQVAPVYATEDMSELREQLEQALAAEIARNEVTIRMGPDGLILSLREAGFFDTASAQVRPEAHAAFSRIARLLKAEGHRLRIEGHTDNVPIHTERFASNWELSTARAIEIIRLLTTEFGYSPNRLAVAGYGEFYPIADNSTEEGRRSNRRVDVVVLAKIKSSAATVEGDR
jgi:chemotaxis protein MotB